MVFPRVALGVCCGSAVVCKFLGKLGPKTSHVDLLTAEQ